MAELEQEVARLRAENQRLRQENAALRGQKEQLTQLAGVTPEGELVESAEAKITTTYDAADDRTIVRTRPMPLNVTHGAAGDHFLSLAYTYPGRTMTERPEAVSLFLQGVRSGDAYEGVKNVIFMMGGEAVEARVTGYDSDHRRVNLAGRRRTNRSDEALTVRVSRELLRKLGAAAKVEGRTGGVRFELGREETALFRAVAKRMEMGL